MIERLVLFGATGDLAGRFLLPALARLKATGDLPAGFRIVGASQENWDDDAFLDHVARRLEEHAADVPAAARAAVCRGLRHVPVDFEDPRTVARVLAAARGDAPATADYEPVAAYLALPAGVFTAAVTALGVIGLPAGSRIALEKPFGEPGQRDGAQRFARAGGRGRG